MKLPMVKLLEGQVCCLYELNVQGLNFILFLDFNGHLIYLYRINNQFYVNICDILQMVNLPVISLNNIKNQLDLLDFIGSILVISVLQSPPLIQELKR